MAAVGEDGRLRYVPLTQRFADALRAARQLRGPRVLSTGDGQALSQKAIEVKMRRVARGISGTRFVRIWR